MSENVTAGNIPASVNVYATIENNSIVPTLLSVEWKKSPKIGSTGIYTFLDGIGKIRHLLSTRPSKEEPMFDI